jgi:hypothetical protein
MASSVFSCMLSNTITTAYKDLKVLENEEGGGV